MANKRKNDQKNYTREAVSFILIALAIILFLSIISYDRADDPNLKIDKNSIEINNLIGPAGAAVADPLMKYTLGYPILFLPVLLLMIGLRLFRNVSLGINLRPMIMLSVWAFFLSVVIAMPESLETYGKIREYYPSGLLGGATASFLTVYLGNFGAVLILTAVFLALLVFSMHLDMMQLLNRIQVIFQQNLLKLKQVFADWQDERKEKKKRAFLEKSRLKAEPEIVKERAPDIRTADAPPAEKRESVPPVQPRSPDKAPSPPPLAEKPMIKTTLEEVLRRAENEEADTTLIKNSGGSSLPSDAGQPAPQTEGEETAGDMSFEVMEEAKVEELDYDRLVKESIARYEFPSVDLLDNVPMDDTQVSHDELKSNAAQLERKLMDFGLEVRVIRVTAGPVITLYELQPAPGVKVSQIVALANDLALAMEARGIRMVAPIPGKAAIGIEIPNRQPQTVYLKPLIRSETYVNAKHILPLALGKTINGEVYCADLTKMPHLLIAGSTGSGKSVGINTVIASILYRIDPGKVKFVMIDPKKIELSLYKKLSEHYLVWRTDLDEEVITKPSNAVSILNTLVLEMETRYDKLAHMGVRNIEDYNLRIRQGGPRIKEEKLQQLPYIIIIIDELADLMMVAAKEVETPIARLTQMARAVGIHLILATQRPSVDVITGVIKANFPARIAYMVTTRADSKTILDMNGAEQLLGNGDMLYQPPGEPRPIRLQNPLITTTEIDRLIAHIRKQPKFPHYSLPQPAESRHDFFDGSNGGGDDLYEAAKEIVVHHQQGSISLLQRRLKIGYSRAARLIDEMEEEGVVGPADGSKPRQVYLLPEDL